MSGSGVLVSAKNAREADGEIDKSDDGGEDGHPPLIRILVDAGFFRIGGMIEHGHAIADAMLGGPGEGLGEDDVLHVGFVAERKGGSVTHGLSIAVTVRAHFDDGAGGANAVEDEAQGFD